MLDIGVLCSPCMRCEISQFRKNIVVGRGMCPADILFMGEAPGRSEDLLGEAFVGPSGKLLNRMLSDAAGNVGMEKPPTYFITNTVLCRPCVLDVQSDEYMENREPTMGEVLNCTEWILKIIRIVDPRLIIFIGKVAERYYKKEFPEAIRIYHPAYLLRSGGTAHPAYPSTLRTLEEAFTRMAHYEKA